MRKTSFPIENVVKLWYDEYGKQVYFPIVDKRNREIAFGGDALTDKKLIGKVHSAVYYQCQQWGYAAPVDVLIDVGGLPKQKSDLKPSFCYYKQWGTKKKNGQGRKPVIPLRFSKSGNPDVDGTYATHYVDTKRIEQIKKESQDKVNASEDKLNR